MSDSEEKASRVMDLYEILTKPVAEMTDDELMEAMGAIREQRKLKIVTNKGKSGLEILISKLSPANARMLLQQLKAQDVAIAEAKTSSAEVEEKK